MIKQKGQGLYVELLEHSFKAVRASAFNLPLKIEAVGECSLEEEGAVQNFLTDFAGLKKNTFIPANCSIYPLSYLLRKATIENMAKAKEPSYIPAFIREQLQVDTDAYKIAVLNAKNGESYDPLKGGSQREILLCSALGEDIEDLQSNLLSFGLYPERMELGTLLTLAGLINYTASQSNPTFALEVNLEASSVFIFKNGQLNIVVKFKKVC